MNSCSGSYNSLIEGLTSVYKPNPVYTVSFNGLGRSERAKKIIQFKCLKFNTYMKPIVRSSEILDFNNVDYIIYIKSNGRISGSIFIYSTPGESEPYFDVVYGVEDSVLGVEMQIAVQTLMTNVSNGYIESYTMDMRSKYSKVS